MIGWVPSTEVVIIQCWEIVMDEGVGVDALNSRTEDQRVASSAAASLGCRHTEDRPKPLAAGEHRVAHRLVQRLRLGRRLGQMPVQRGVDLLDRTVDVTLKRKRFGLGLFVMGTWHAKVLSNPLQPHKTEATYCQQIRRLIDQSAEENETSNHLFNRGCFNDRLRQTDASRSLSP